MPADVGQIGDDFKRVERDADGQQDIVRRKRVTAGRRDRASQEVEVLEEDENAEVAGNRERDDPVAGPLRCEISLHGPPGHQGLNDEQRQEAHVPPAVKDQSGRDEPCNPRCRKVREQVVSQHNRGEKKQQEFLRLEQHGFRIKAEKAAASRATLRQSTSQLPMLCHCRKFATRWHGDVACLKGSSAGRSRRGKCPSMR